MSVNLILDATPATIWTPYSTPPPPPYAPAPAKLCRALPCCVLCSLMSRAPEHIVHIRSWCYVHRSTLPLSRQRTTSSSSTAAEWIGTAEKYPQVPKSCLIASRAFPLATARPHHSPSSPLALIESEIYSELI